MCPFQSQSLAQPGQVLVRQKSQPRHRIMSLNRSVTGIMQPSRYSHTSGTDDPQQRQDSLDLPPSSIFPSRDDNMILSSLHQQKQALCPEGDLQAVIAFSSDLSVQSDERVG